MSDDGEGALRVRRLSENATLPMRATPNACGYDLYSAAPIVIPAMGRVLVPTDIAVAIPSGHYGRIAPRSSLALNHGIDVGAGVIDSDYRGHVQVLLFNFAQAPFQVAKGDRIAQLIIEKISTPPIIEVESLDGTLRGDGGFGSTGRS
ncbi:deoxyuridine triphosphatase [Pelomyxa schiedti]|nr:deoxyuridine triphosphatase [Pelomyxa schiedti]